jgi:amino-acid N-acetyltransferase
MSSVNEINSTISAHLVTSIQELGLLKDFLMANQLPAEDIQLENSSYLIFTDSNQQIVGCGGLEFYDEYALLRSLAVNQNIRGHHVGKHIVTNLLALARERYVKEVYLLTNTAFYFFLKFGFDEVSREDVEAAVKESTEFKSVCPISARVMKLTL